LVPFLAFLFFPWGDSRLPLYFIDDNGMLIGVFGVSIGYYQGMPVVAWWFLTADVIQLLIGVIYWFFPFISCLLCIFGSKQPPEKGKKVYIAAFFLQLIVLVLLFIDAFVLGQSSRPFLLSRTYGVLELLAALNVGFWIYVFDMALAMIAAFTYKEA